MNTAEISISSACIRRNARIADIERILEINQQNVRARLNTQEWFNGFNTYKLSKEIIKELVAESFRNEDIRVVVCESLNEVVGYTICFLVSPDNKNDIHNTANKIMGEECGELITLNHKRISHAAVIDSNDPTWQEIEGMDKSPVPFTFWFQIAIDRRNRRKGFGTTLTNYVAKELADKNQSKFTIGPVEIQPAFNLAQFGFLYKKHGFNLLAVVPTKLNKEGSELCLFFQRRS